jgi:hypothetical protein
MLRLRILQVVGGAMLMLEIFDEETWETVE